MKVIDPNFLLSCIDYGKQKFGSRIFRWSDIRYLIERCPKIEVSPVERGEWLPPIIGEYGCVCSKCMLQADNDYDFCPNCGSPMDRGAKE